MTEYSKSDKIKTGYTVFTATEIYVLEYEMKKSVFLILAVLLALTVLLVACDDNKDPQPPRKTERASQRKCRKFLII